MESPFFMLNFFNMKIIFLDIDGVLNSDSWLHIKENRDKPFPSNQFEPRLITLFNKLVQETQAKVVLISTWRLKYSLEEMRNFFQKVGIKCNLIDMTPDLTSGNDYVVRGNEILKWCKDNVELLEVRHVLHYKNFVIIDDHDHMLYWQRKHFFQTDPYSGLTPTITRNIIRELNR